ncbi:DUF4129 domain-containing protein [Halomontanus rarus]|uniref:DUF4129 domain-containing protein n=1 Tax=Halomontanus rarus TaxID=3034020 RepID=UPI001A98ADA7
MSRRSLLVRVAGVVVGIVAVALAAATIDNPVEPGGTGGAGGGEGSGLPPTTEQPPAEGGGFEIPAFLEYLVIALLIVAALALAWYLISHRRDAVKLIAVALGVGLVILALVYLFMQLEPSSMMNQSEMGEMNETPSGGGEPGEGDGTDNPVPRSLMTLLVALLVVTSIFVGALVVSRRDSDSVAGSESAIETDRDDDNAAAVAAAAGRAAERIESSGDDDVDNAVYRAWRDMTRLLEVDRPETSTPREFAEAAIDAGLAREDVDELTRLFEDTRYGHAETTEEMETRAVSVLRRIEDEYAEQGDEDGGEGDAPNPTEGNERPRGGR